MDRNLLGPLILVPENIGPENWYSCHVIHGAEFAEDRDLPAHCMVCDEPL